MLYIQFWAPDDGRRNSLKHVEHFTEINKLCNVASCWLYLEIRYVLFDSGAQNKNKVWNAVWPIGSCDVIQMVLGLIYLYFLQWRRRCTAHSCCVSLCACIILSVCTLRILKRNTHIFWKTFVLRVWTLCLKTNVIPERKGVNPH